MSSHSSQTCTVDPTADDLLGLEPVKIQSSQDLKLIKPVSSPLKAMDSDHPSGAQNLVDAALSQWAQGGWDHETGNIQSWAEYSQIRMIEPMSSLLLNQISYLVQKDLSDSELHLCKTLCQGAFLSIGVQLGLRGMCDEQPSPLVKVVMSLLGMDKKRALSFCDAQILLGADEFFGVLRDSGKMPEVSHNVRLYMEKLCECLPYEVLPAVFSSSKPKEEAQYGVEQEMNDDLDAPLNGSKVNGHSEKSRVSEPMSMEEETWQVIASPLIAPSLQPVTAPIEYVSSLKSKGVRNKLIRALTAWIPIPESTLQFTMSLIDDVHNTSLMLDDVQDNSPLRRSCPATHTIFGVGQTVNSAVYQTVNLIKRSFNTNNPLLTKELLVGMENLLVGQSLDLCWTQEITTPTVQEYLQMIDGKTGALFVMIYRLMVAVSPTQKPQPGLERLMMLLGRYFQIRDDFLNLASPDYSKAKGYCEDLDEGKCSFIILHAMNNARPQSWTILRNILLQQRRNGSLGVGHKETILAIIEETGSLTFTKGVMNKLEDMLFQKLNSVEAATDVKNPDLRGLLDALRS